MLEGVGPLQMTAPPGIIPGQQIGHWQILSITGRTALCRCRCKQIRQVSIAALEDGSSVSCRCSPKKLATTRPRLPDWRPQR